MKNTAIPLLLVFGVLGLAIPCKAGLAQPYALGISLDADAYEQRAFADMFKDDARVWKPGTMTLGRVDRNGMPTTDCDIFVLDGAAIKNTAGFNGTYRLYLNGLADVATALGGVVRNKSYDSTQNQTTADLVITQPFPTIELTFRNTRRTLTSKTNTGVYGLKLMRPTSIGGTSTYAPGTVFTTDFVALHGRGQVLRFMDFTATNGNLQKNWSDRNTTSTLTFFRETSGYGWQGKGAPWEYAILLANSLKKDIWINIPTYATDDYVTHLAQLLDSSLDKSLHIYFEYSNEIWNFSFAQWGQVSGLVDDDLKANPNTTINYDQTVLKPGGTVDYGVGVPRYWVRRQMQFSNIFRKTFGDADMGTRIRPLFETQAAWQTWLAQGLIFLDTYYNNGDGISHISTPHPVNYYLWGGGGSAYIEGFPLDLLNKSTVTLDQVFSGYQKAWPIHYQTMAADTYWVSAFGLQRVAYEAGPGIDPAGRPGDPQAQQAQIDPRINSVYKRNADIFFQAGGALYLTYLGVGSTHGLLPYDSVMKTASYSEPAYKLAAFNTMLAATQRPAVTVGYAIPGTLYGGRYHVREDGWSTGDSNGPVQLSGAYSWVGYTIHNPASGQYKITLNTANSAGGLATLWLDGVAVQERMPCPNGGTTKATVVTLARGVHALRVQLQAHSFDLNSISVSATP